VSHFWLHLGAFLVAVCLLVTVHEFGHFWVARRLGFKVLRFSVGFGRPVWTRVGKVDGTEFVLAAVPLGGYVKMLDEREGPVAALEVARAFNRRPPWQRIAVLLAGPAANFLFAIALLAGMLFVSGSTDVRAVVGSVAAQSRAAQAGVLAGDEIVAVNGKPVRGQREVWLDVLDSVTVSGPLTLRLRDSAGQERAARLDTGSAIDRRSLSEPTALLSGLGLSFQEPTVPAVLGAVEAGGPAGLAGLRAGDTILSINGEPVRDFMALVALVHAHPDESITVRYRRAGAGIAAGEESVARVETRSTLQDGRRIGSIKVVSARGGTYPEAMLRHVKLGPGEALLAATREAWNMTAFQARMLWRMLAGEVSVKNLSGPLTIAQLAGDSAAAGIGAFLDFLVLISLALGFMNLLPIPILDGGQIVMQVIEWLKGSPLSERAQLAGQQMGIALVVLLLSVALYNDIARQFG